ncbi:uncharacterized protein LOC123530062 [Mercenaria mercenaria]|uniref:uncharacterized protein LOC123530062 n=1 Tax=Mercenaria mercenaria TaxID=6596 RepID=UPI00234EEDA1|nr:uncharacterized protein LOC123530062 [Mercenaria mercenaria]
MCEKMFTLLIVMLQLLAASRSYLTVLVTKEQCGRSIDLTLERKVYLNYEGAELWDNSSTCVIDITTRNDNEKICIRKNNTSFIDLMCSSTLTYYAGGYTGYSYGAKSCSDFNFRAFCDSNRKSSLVYQENFFYNTRNVTVSVVVYLKRNIQTTTRRSYTRAPWSSWTSWSSSDYGKYDGGKPKSKTKGLVIGLIVVGACLVFGCICAMLRERMCPPPEYSAPPAVENETSAPLVQYNREDQHTANQTQNAASGFQPQQPSDNAGNHVHNSTFKQVPNQDSQAGYQSDLPPPTYDSIPSAPPPPYPGY